MVGCSFEKMFYFPNKTLTHQKEADSLGFEHVTFASKNGNSIDGYYVIPKDTVYGAILLLHGNAGNISDQISSLLKLQKAGFEVLVIDYQGFGNSQGEVSHQNLVDDAESALNYLEYKTKSRNISIILLGRSIGGHLAVKIAHDHQKELKALVIEGAFTPPAPARSPTPAAWNWARPSPPKRSPRPAPTSKPCSRPTASTRAACARSSNTTRKPSRCTSASWSPAAAARVSPSPCSRAN